MNKRNLIITILIMNGIWLTCFNVKTLGAGVFNFNDGTTQGWTLDQMYLSSSQTKFSPLSGYTLMNTSNALSAYTSALLIGSADENDIYLQSPDLSTNTDWQGISGFSVDVTRLLYTPCWGDFPGLFYVQLQVKVIDLSDGNKEKLYAEHDGTDFVFHEIKTFSQLYQITWNASWLNNTSKYKVKHVRIRIIGPGDASMAECWYRGAWSIDNVTAIGGSGGSTSSVTLTNPNGGQSWAAETPHYITWTATNINDKDFKLEYSTDNGSTYNFITYVTHYGSSGSYLWDVPNAASTQCLVRISMQNPQISDVSNSVFAITADKKITVDVPDGNENWTVGSLHYIVWHNYLFNGPVKIEYSTNGGAGYSVIENSYSTSTSYAWTVPNTPSNNCLVRISDASNSALNDISDAPFTISSTTTTNTLAGSNVQVDLGSGVGITFNEVINPGNTEALIQPVGPLPPEGMLVIPEGLPNYYEINTTATSAGGIQLFIGYSDAGIGPDQEMALKLYAFNPVGSAWEDITTNLDVQNNMINGQTDHLSVFSIMMSSTGPGTSSIVVTNTQETGPGSLGEAIYRAEIQPGYDTIRFNIPKSDPGYDAATGIWTISPKSFFQAMTEGGIVIDGFSQREFLGEDTNPYGPEIQISGTDASPNTDGLFLRTNHAEILGLTINHFRCGIVMAGVKGGRIAGCYIGTNYSATAPAGNDYGIILYDSTENVVISHYDTCRNVISGNNFVGIGIHDTCYHNAVLNNIVGMDRTESKAIPNGNYGGIHIQRGSFENVIVDNHISGNNYGIYLNQCHDNLIAQNWIGTDPGWLLTLGNNESGIMMADGSYNNLVQGNLIGNSGGSGIKVEGSQAVRNTITHNLISTNTQAGIDNESGGNHELESPVVEDVTPEWVKGSGLPDAKIEIFSDPEDEGAVFQGETTADASGNFTWNGTIIGPYNHITANATDAEGNTSEFSVAFTVAELPPSLLINQLPGFFDPTPLGHQSVRETIVSGNNLMSPIVLKAPEGFKLAIAPGENPVFSDSVIIGLTNHHIEPTLVVILFEPEVAKEYHDSITVKSAGAARVYIPLAALCFGPPVIEAIKDQEICEGDGMPEILLNFEFFSPDEVEFIGISDNETFIASEHIVFIGEGNSRLITLEPDQPVGEAQIMVIAVAPGDLKDTVTFMSALYPSPVIQSLDIVPESAGNDGKIVVHATSAVGGLKYALNNGIFQQSNEFAGLPEGEYLVTVGDISPCMDTMTATVTNITAVQKFDGIHPDVFPNPASTFITLSPAGDLHHGYSVEIVNMYGEIVMKVDPLPDGTMEISELPDGVYILRLRSGIKIYNVKLVINQ